MSAQQYGIALRWSTVGAPKPFGCILDGFEYNENLLESTEPDDEGDIAFLKPYGRTGAINFAGTVTEDSTDLPDLSAGALIEVDSPDVTSGIVLCSELVEEWSLGQPKKFNGRATHYPDATGGTGAAAGALDGFTPAQSLSPVLRPADKVIWSTQGLTSALGTIQRLRIRQALTLSAELDGAGKYTSITAHAYMRRIQLEVLGLASQSRPAANAILSVTGAPAHAANAEILNSGIKWTKGQRAMFTVDAMWAPSF